MQRINEDEIGLSKGGGSMNKMNKIVSSMIFGLALISLVAPRQADATPTLELSDGTTTITVADGGGTDLNPAPGNVSFAGSIGLWTLTTTSGTTHPILGSTTSPHLELLHGNAKSAGIGTLTIKFSENGFNTSPVAWVAALTAGGQAAGESAQYKTYADAGNAIFATTTPLTDSGPLLGSPFTSTKISPVFGDPSFS